MKVSICIVTLFLCAIHTLVYSDSNNCESLHWNTIHPGKFLTGKSKRGTTDFAGFWELLKTTPEGEPARIYASYTVSGYSEKSPNSLTCRSMYQLLDYSGEWTFDDASNAFVNNMTAVGYLDQPDDACGPAQTLPQSFGVIPSGTIVSSTSRWERKSLPGLQPAGYYSPSWGPGYTPEETDVRYQLHGDAFGSALAKMQDPLVGEELRTWLEVLSAAPTFEGNQGAPVRGTFSGQAAWFTARLAFPCPADMEVEFHYKVTYPDGSHAYQTRHQLVPGATPDASGYYQLTGAIPIEHGKVYELEFLRYRDVPSCKTNNVTLGSVYWTHSCGNRLLSPFHAGLFKVHLAQIPTQLTAAILTFSAPAESPAIRIYRDLSETALRQVITDTNLYTWNPTEATDEWELSAYSLDQVIESEFSPESGFQLQASAVPSLSYRFSLANDAGADPQLTITSSAGAEVRFQQSLLSGIWSLNRGNDPFEAHLMEIELPGRRETRRWRSDAAGEVFAQTATVWEEFSSDGQNALLKVADYRWPSRTEDWDPATALARRWSYSTRADSFGELSLFEETDGWWQRTDWTESGPIKVFPVGNLAPDAAPEECRVISDVEVPADDGSIVHWQIEHSAGSVSAVAATRREWVTGDTTNLPTERIIHRRYNSPSAATDLRWDTPGYRESINDVLADGPLTGLPARSADTSGVVAQWKHVRQRDFARQLPVLRSELLTGETDAEGVVRWKDSLVLIRDFSGNTLSEIISDLESGVTTFHRTVLATDHFGRPTLVAFGDGTTETLQYDCCGLTNRVSADGVEESWLYDADGNLLDYTKDGVSLTSRIAIGNLPGTQERTLVKTFSRIGRDGTNLPGDIEYLDFTGRLRFKAYADGRSARYSYGQSPTGASELEINYNDGRTETFAWSRDRTSAHRGSFPLAHQLSFGVDELLHEVEISSYRWTQWSRQLDDDRTASSPVATFHLRQYHDLLGDPIRTIEWLDGDVTSVHSSSYSLDNRTAITTDPDGVVSIRQRDGIGRRLQTAVDLDRDNIANPLAGDWLRAREWVSGMFADHQPYIGRHDNRRIDSKWHTIGSQYAALAQPASTLVSPSGSVTVQTAYNTPLPGQYQVRSFHGDGRRLLQRYEQTRLLAEELTNEAGHILEQVTYDYDAFNRVTAEHHANGVEFHYQWDQADRLLHIEEISTAVENGATLKDRLDLCYSIDRNGLQQVTQTRNHELVSHVWVDSAGRLVAASGYARTPHVRSLDESGRIRSLFLLDGDFNEFPEDELLNAARRYDYFFTPAGKISQIRHPDGTLQHFQYTAGQRLLAYSVRNPFSDDPPQGIEYNYPQHSDGTLIHGLPDGFRLIGADHPQAQVSWEFDSSGRISQLQDASNLSSWQYTGLQPDSQTWLSGPLQGWSWQVNYDKSQRTGWIRLTREDSPSYMMRYLAEDDFANGTGRLQRIAGHAGSWRFHYAESIPFPARLTIENSSGPVEISRSFEHGSRITSTAMTTPSGVLQVRREYDQHGRLVRLHDFDGLYWEYGYDVNGRLQSAVKHLANGAPVPGYDFQYAYDRSGNRTAHSAMDQEQISTYDPTDRAAGYVGQGNSIVRGEVAAQHDTTVQVNDAVAASAHGFFAAVVGRDPEDPGTHSADDSPRWQAAEVLATAQINGNPATMRRVIHVFQPPVVSAFSYDSIGNLIEDDRWHYEWDALQRLIAVETSLPARTAGIAHIRMEFDYDYRSRRCAIRSFEVDPLVGALALVDQRQLVYADNLLIAEFRNGQRLVDYIWGPDISQSLGGAGGREGLLAVHFPQRARTYYPVTDGYGNILAYWGEAEQTVVARLEYCPFGQLLRATGPMAAELSFGYASQFTDYATGLIYFGSRFYHPRLGRWLGPDPIGHAGGLNLYAFVNNDPLNAFDPTGQLTFDWYGNWGGPGRVNGASGAWSERDNFPRRGHPDFVEPIDSHDACYYSHDTCLGDVRCGSRGLFTTSAVQQAEKQCDFDLSACLVQLGDPLLSRSMLTAFAFRTVIGNARVNQQQVRRPGPAGKGSSAIFTPRNIPCGCGSK